MLTFVIFRNMCYGCCNLFTNARLSLIGPVRRRCYELLYQKRGFTGAGGLYAHCLLFTPFPAQDTLDIRQLWCTKHNLVGCISRYQTISSESSLTPIYWMYYTHSKGERTMYCSATCLHCLRDAFVISLNTDDIDHPYSRNTAPSNSTLIVVGLICDTCVWQKHLDRR